MVNQFDQSQHLAATVTDGSANDRRSEVPLTHGCRCLRCISQGAPQ